MIKKLKDKLAEAVGSDQGEVSEGGQLSEGASGFGDAETSVGGADAVPGTPDATPSTSLGEEEVDRVAGAS